MMGKVTILFGAGASANAISTVAGLPDQIEALRAGLSIHKCPFPNNVISHKNTETFQSVKDEIVAECSRILGLLKENPTWSIDDLAHDRFRNQDWGTLYTIKIILSFCLMQQQIGPQYDYRYKILLNEIAKGHIGDWEDVRILTWNYDYQLELALRECVGFHSDSILELQKNLRSQPAETTIRDYTEQFSVYKLNGTLAYKDNFPLSVSYPLDKISNQSNEALYEKLIYHYYMTFNFRLFPQLNFAWEKSADTLIEMAKKAIHGSKAVSVIGYTFPYVNRAIDMQLLESLSEHCKIYVQMPEANIRQTIEALKDRLPDLWVDQMKIIPKPISDEDLKTGRFYLPSVLGI